VNILEGGQGKDSITAASGRDTIVFGAELLPDVSLHADFINKFQAVKAATASISAAFSQA
jgi:hypothetical protein